MPHYLSDDNEPAFLEWMAAHPDGFVVNIDKAHTSKHYPLAHHANCKTLHNRDNYANDCYQNYAGTDSTLRGGSLAEFDREMDRATRIEVSEKLGNSRESLSTHYLGR